MVYVWISLAVLAADRLLKLWSVAVLANIPEGIVLIPGVVRLVYAENTGVAFGLLSGQSMTIVTVTVCLIAVVWFLLHRYALGAWAKTALALALGGAVGNVLDRLIYGCVIDMIDLLFVRFAIFNIADSAITIGGLLLAISLLFRAKDWRRRA